MRKNTSGPGSEQPPSSTRRAQLKSHARLLGLGRPPKFEWPTPGADTPRLPWADYLRLWAGAIDQAAGGEPGRFLCAYLLGLAAQAEALGATSPAEHERRAQAEAEREAAWIAALEAEVEQPGLGMTTPDPDDPEVTGGLDGHPSQDEGAHRVWIGADPYDETYCN
ncbi:MAG TPA: hypothetical protein VKP69_33705 [Isosphaeraceae bacterium]|nr:hypothetical protein [Isosphaeraceae bacterium]